MEFFALIFLAVIVEGIVEWIKTIYKSGKFQVSKLIALLVGIIVCIGADVDVFRLVDVSIEWPYVGSVLTGILISRGSNYIHELTDVIGKGKQVVERVETVETVETIETSGEQ